MSDASKIRDNWPCLTCPVRDAGFCGTLLGQHSADNSVHARPDWQDFRAARPNEGICARGEDSEHLYVLCGGWAFRFVQLSDGRRQTLRFLLAGDLFSAVSLFAERIHFSVQALTQLRFARFKRDEVRKRLAANAALSTALATSCIAEDIANGELLLALGRRSAEERIAYVFLHLMRRLAQTNVIRENRYPVPLRHQQIAAITGLTPVHVSRILTIFRDRGLCRLSDGILQVDDVFELERIGSVK